ncbi:SPW repeat domain-containing protein [Allokutzneria albata]|nr:SPW repeat protein [Allokutzneria albata]
MAKAWTRWQDWAAVVLGVVLMLTPAWSETTDRAMWTMIVFGALLGLAGLWSLAMPGSVASEWTHVVIGALVFIAPWAMGYADMMGAAWTSWIVGVLAVAVGAAALPEANAAHRGLAGSH